MCCWILFECFKLPAVCVCPYWFGLCFFSTLMTGMNSNTEINVETQSFACPISENVCLHIITSLAWQRCPDVPVSLKQDKTTKENFLMLDVQKWTNLNVLLKKTDRNLTFKKTFALLYIWIFVSGKAFYIIVLCYFFSRG